MNLYLAYKESEVAESNSRVYSYKWNAIYKLSRKSAGQGSFIGRSCKSGDLQVGENHGVKKYSENTDRNRSAESIMWSRR